jgi:hypothetical protein
MTPSMSKNEPLVQPTLKELFLSTANSMKRAFPSYEALTISDITIGLAAVAVEHKKQNLLKNLYDEPCLFQVDETDYDYGAYKPGEISEVNPEGVDPQKLIIADKLLNYAYVVHIDTCNF